MRFGSQVNNALRLVFRKDAFDLLDIQDIYFLENIIGLILNVPEVLEVTGIGEGIKVDYTIVRVFIYKQPDHVRADKAGSACYYY